jgi:hypothetical protein
MRDGVIAGASSLAVVAVMLAPIVLAGGLGELREQALDNGGYLRVSSVPYSDGLWALWHALGSALSDPAEVGLYAVFLVPPLAAAAIAIALGTDRERRRELVPVAVFLVAAVVPALPRAHYFKVSDAVPFCALALAVSIPSLRELAPRRSREPGRFPASSVAAGAATVLCLLLLGSNLLVAPLESRAAGAALSDLPHYGGTLITNEQEDRVQDQIDRLRAADAGTDTTFILSFAAAYLHLTSGISGTTPYDYPTGDEMGEAGQRDVIARIKSGEIQRVCLGSFRFAELKRPAILEEWIRAGMRPVDPGVDVDLLAIEQCALYERERPNMRRTAKEEKSR